MASTALVGGATLLKAGSSIAKGRAAKKAGKYEEAQLNEQADRVLGVGSREAYEIGRDGKRIASDTTAGRAAGGGAVDAGSIERQAQIATEIRYNALSALYDADEEAAQLREQGRQARKAGKRAEVAGYAGATGSILDGAGKLL